MSLLLRSLRRRFWSWLFRGKNRRIDWHCFGNMYACSSLAWFSPIFKLYERRFIGQTKALIWSIQPFHIPNPFMNQQSSQNDTHLIVTIELKPWFKALGDTLCIRWYWTDTIMECLYWTVSTLNRLFPRGCCYATCWSGFVCYSLFLLFPLLLTVVSLFFRIFFCSPLLSVLCQMPKGMP